MTKEETNKRKNKEWLDLVHNTLTNGASQENSIGPSIMGSMTAMVSVTPDLKNFMPEDPANPWSSIIPSFDSIESFINSKLVNEQRRFEFLMAEFDSASQSDHPIAMAFVGRIFMYGVDEEMYKGAINKYNSNEVESAQNALNMWSMSCFEAASDEMVAFRTKLVDMVAYSYMQNMHK